MENKVFSFNFKKLKESNYKFKDIFGDDFLKEQEFICNNKLDEEGKPVNKKEEMNSFSFAGDLDEIFGLEKNDLYREKYNQAISGDGQEEKKIYTLHSSSLLALLFFYNVTKDNSIFIDGTEYGQSYFEVKNNVFNTPSNIDIVLVSKDNTKILYLESKFTEYLFNGKAYEISKQYEDFYKNLDYNELRIKRTNTFNSKRKNSKGKIVFNLESKNTPQDQYCVGIKQLISHYIGINNGLNETQSERGELSEAIERASSLVLGEIIYSFDCEKEDNYKTLYSEVAKQLNEKKDELLDQTCNRCKISVLPHLLTYQDLLKDNEEFKLAETIKSFYKF